MSWNGGAQRLDATAVEEVVLLDSDGGRIGTADKSTVHHRDTPLHLAFSAYVFNSRRELLLTRRAATKRTWPNVWTNSCCGHPLPGEPLPSAVARRLGDELGLTATAIDLVLPRFRYRAEMSNGVVENELCPVYRVRTEMEPTPRLDEVSETRWIHWDDFVGAVFSDEFTVSPWCAEQMRALTELAGGPDDWQVAAQAELPPAARLTSE
ncbi:isopentenyl-diphosphate Delta-isomerase [Stackebrandtia soli]|uniref:isopentenyl-diphosphate Delta-isomerase n=1 Tax=Stackebrandtia soli TaxID=1892856 RepID=UPI0039EBE75E